MGGGCEGREGKGGGWREEKGREGVGGKRREGEGKGEGGGCEGRQGGRRGGRTKQTYKLTGVTMPQASTSHSKQSPQTHHGSTVLLIR